MRSFLSLQDPHGSRSERFHGGGNWRRGVIRAGTSARFSFCVPAFLGQRNGQNRPILFAALNRALCKPSSADARFSGRAMG